MMVRSSKVLVLWTALTALVSAVASGQEGGITREMLVATVERTPGPTKGRQDAPITMVEFSDFQCHFCRKFWKETLPRIEAEYINSGKVRFIYRHLIGQGAPSLRAAEAVECAQEQRKFWPYHGLLFGRAGPLAFTDGRFKTYAQELGVDGKAFDVCLASGRHRNRILQETEVARYLGARGTPTFLINGQLLIGARPFETFRGVLETMLAAARREKNAPLIRMVPGPATPPARP